jgi:CRP/FNR family cyclic AMP-dependent transcriptional regulator
MDEKSKRLRSRLNRLWESPNFTALFTTKKKPPTQFIRKGTIIFNTGDPLGRLYLILEGYLKIYRLSEEGKETTSYLIGPGNILGIRTLLTEDDRTMHTAEAITDLKVLTTSRTDCLERLVRNPELLVDLMQVFRDRLSYMEKKFESFVYASTTSRVAIFLSDCAVRFGKKKNGKILIELELTHQRIADFVGAFRETVTNTLHNLEREKIITTSRGRITILNLQKLENLTSFNGKRNKDL